MKAQFTPELIGLSLFSSARLSRNRWRSFHALSLFCGMAVFASFLVSRGEAGVLYRENFGNQTTGYTSYGSVGWNAYKANNDLSNVSDGTATASASLGISNETGNPTNLPNVNAGISTSDTNGFGLLRSGQRMLVYEGQFAIDRSITQIDSVKVHAAQYRATGAATQGSLRLALLIDSQWYVSQATALSAATIPIMTGSTALEQEAEFSLHASQYSFDMGSAVWYRLTVTPGTPFVIGSSSTDLPATGAISAFGLYAASPSSGGLFFDSFTVHATSIPEGGTTVLFGLGLGVFLVAAKRAGRKGR